MSLGRWDETVRNTHGNLPEKVVFTFSMLFLFPSDGSQELVLLSSAASSRGLESEMTFRNAVDKLAMTFAKRKSDKRSYLEYTI